MKNLTGSATAEVKDFSLVNAAAKEGDADFGKRRDGSKTVEVKYDFKYDEIETGDELRKEFSETQLISLANARKKASANSSARQSAVAPYAQDPNSNEALRESMIADMVKIKKVSPEIAAKLVDAALNANV